MAAGHGAPTVDPRRGPRHRGDHAHAAHGRAHVHGLGRRGGLRALTFALVLNAAYTAVEAAVGIATGSLALVADAGHNLSDVVALAIAVGAVLLARRPATPARSFGLVRAEVLAALVNAISLVVIATLVFVEAARRFAAPVDVPGGWLIAVAALGVAINGAGAAAVFRRGGSDLNLRASFVHLAGDALGSALVIVGGIVLLTTGWRFTDPVLGVALGLLILASSWGVLRDSVLVLLEAAPRDMSVEDIGNAMAARAGVVEVHDLHVWTISNDFTALSAHVLVGAGDDCHGVRRDLERMLSERFSIRHTTLQVDHVQDALLVIPPRAR